MSHDAEKSDCCVVPKKLPNKAVGQVPAAAQAVEGRRQAKGNTSVGNVHRASNRVRASSVRRRIRRAASCWSYRHDPRQEPYAVVPHVRICGGGAG